MSAGQNAIGETVQHDYYKGTYVRSYPSNFPRRGTHSEKSALILPSRLHTGISPWSVCLWDIIRSAPGRTRMGPSHRGPLARKWEDSFTRASGRFVGAVIPYPLARRSIAPWLTSAPSILTSTPPDTPPSEVPPMGVLPRPRVSLP